MKLSDPISNWLPELKDMKVEVRTPARRGRPRTSRPAPDHRAGPDAPHLRLLLRRERALARIKEMYHEANIESRENDITGDEMLKRLGQIPLAHQPGTTFEYSISIDVLGLLLERVAEEAARPALKELLFEPLGMNDTAFGCRPTSRAAGGDARQRPAESRHGEGLPDH